MTNPKEALEWYERKRVEARAMADRNCEQCKHHKADGCSRWDCEYEPRMVEVVRCEDCKWHLNGHLCKQLSQHYGSIETPPSFYCGLGERMVKHERVNSLHER